MVKKNRRNRRQVLVFITLILFVGSMMSGYRLQAEVNSKSVTLLFSHDMHDHFRPQMKNVDGKIESIGGYGRIQTMINEERKNHSELLLLDAGDFSMGTLFQTIYASDAPQLRMMGKMGYDVVTLGNHEFDFRAKGLEKSLEAAMVSQDKLPTIVASNIDLNNASTTQDLKSLEDTMNTYGIAPYTVIEKEGVRIGVFGVIGKDAQSNAPMAGVKFTDSIEKAQEVTKLLVEKEKVDLIICLSHSGTSANKKQSEDELLARKVPDIDVIISGHTHTKLDQPIVVGETIIGSCGEYGENLGKMKIVQNSKGRWELESYKLIPIDQTVAENQEIVHSIEDYQKMVEQKYLTHFGYRFDELLGRSGVGFESGALIGKKHQELRLGNFISDAYHYAVKQAEGDDYKPIAMVAVPSGTIRGSFVDGEISVADVFTVSSLGIGKDGTAGYPLVSAYLTGKEIKTVCEVDASIAPIMSEAQLYLSGVNFTFNPHRLIFNKVTDCYLIDEDGNRQSIEEDQLYRVVVGLYSAQMLSVVGEKSFGILSIVPKDQNGVPIANFEDSILRNPKTGEELKEWVAIASYIQSFDVVNGLPQIPNHYSHVESRKVIDEDKNLVALIKQPNQIAWVVYGIVSFLVVVIISFSVNILKKKRNN